MSGTLSRHISLVDKDEDASVTFNLRGNANRLEIDGGILPQSEGFPHNVLISHGDFVSDVYGLSMFAPDPQLEMATDGANDSLDGLAAWQDELIPQLNSYTNTHWSWPSEIPFQETPNNMSVGYLLNQSPTESVTQMNGDDTVVCYGKLHSIDVRLVGDMSAIERELREIDAKYQYLKLISRKDLKTQTDNLIVCFRDSEKDFGCLRSKETQTILEVFSLPSVDFEAVAPRLTLLDIIKRANKLTDAVVKVDINVYGLRGDSSLVGDALSGGKLWLQRPSDHTRDGITYENPHFLNLKIKDGMVNSALPLEPAVNNKNSEPRTARKGDQLQTLVEEVNKSVDNDRGLNIVEGGTRVTRTLLRHQQQALGFMMGRESGDIDDKYRLWKDVTLEIGKVEYQHKITKARRPSRPEESGGGILADEMGMGKSLSILALAMKTLDKGREWAEAQSNVSEKVTPTSSATKGPAKHSRSTLIVVSSGLLITNWEDEIDKHLEGGLKVIRYHGRKRPKDLNILQDSDIVITTYNTLVVEYEMNKTQPSVLYRIGWYRVVLDEAHIIRRPSSKFFHSCNDLHANSRWCLTGTPIQNKLADIGTLFAFTRAQPFDKASVFRKWIELPFEHSTGNQKKLKDRLVMLYEAYCLRRTKDMVKLSPPKEDIRYLVFSPEEREQYKKTERTLMRSIMNRVGDIEKGSKFGQFQAYLQLRILCNHGTFQKPFSWHRRSYQTEREAAVSVLGTDGEIKCSVCRQSMPIVGSSLLRDRFEDQCSHVLCAECIGDSNTTEPNVQPRSCPICMNWNKPKLATTSSADNDDDYFDSDGYSTKMKTLLEDVKEDLYETKSIIFSCWTRTLQLVSKHLTQAKIPFLCIDGNCSLQKRQDNLNLFENKDEWRVLIMTTGTGAFGLNLTCANRVFIVELQWNPSVENQAIARTIRLGQKSEVRVIKYITRNTVEEGIGSQQVRKRLIAAVGFHDSEAVDEEMPDTGEEAMMDVRDEEMQVS